MGIIFANVIYRFDYLEIRNDRFLIGFVALDRPHDANDLSVSSIDRMFLGYEHVEKTLLIIPEFEMIDERGAGGNDMLIVEHKTIGDMFGEMVVVSCADERFLILQSESH